MFSLHTFGGLKLLDGDGRKVAFPEKGLLILAYLMTEPTSRAPRSAIAQLLWGLDDNGSAQVNLRKLVSRIRSRQGELGSSFLRFSETTVELEPHLLASDISALDAAADDQVFARLQLLTKTLPAEFLPDVDCESPVFFGWRAGQTRHHIRMLKETIKAAAEATTADDSGLVREAVFLFLSLDPQDRDIHPVLLQIFDASGEAEHFRQLSGRRNALLAAWWARKSGSPHLRDEKGISLLADLAAVPQEIRMPFLVLSPAEGPAGGYDASSLVEDVTIGFCALNSLEAKEGRRAIQIGWRNAAPAGTSDRQERSYALEMRFSGHDNETLLFSQLVDAASDEIVWADRLKIAPCAHGQQRQEISRHLVLSLAGQIERCEMTRSHFEGNPAGHQRYLAGRRYLDRLSVSNLQKARTELKAALQSGGPFAPALGSIARTYSKQWLLTAGDDAALLQEAEAYALQAIAARRDIADGYRELGVAKSFQGANDESIEALELADALNPNHAGIIADHAEALVYASKPDLGLQKIEHALALNPLSPDSYLWIASAASYMLGSFDAALGYIARMADTSLADRISAASWAMLGDEERAGFFVRRVHQANPGFDVDKWLSVIPFKEQWQHEIYRDGLRRAGFWKSAPNSGEA
ncbi:hypothetical protein [Rhizobium sp. P44RR-XXIV]|uniref:hypothetical protein n=1 Tax=Rhizobium sp. P44RR-XXIV TaxID=1921145 RepID=UPI0010A9A6EE|nr:hypothetical protein [Rhizobium sp. P44RR-XXIV]TIX89402.1 hypothetical protein BSK43_022755 [Rhizobium sp. P44RR-XXIV]